MMVMMRMMMAMMRVMVHTMTNTVRSEKMYSTIAVVSSRVLLQLLVITHTQG